MKNPYEVLNVKQGSTKEEIKDAYKKLALEWHPDRHQGDSKAEEKFKEISAAYQLIKDGNYNPSQNQRTNPFQNINDIFNATFVNGNGGAVSFQDLWGSVPNGRKINKLDLFLSLQEMRNGVKKKISIFKNNPCIQCFGIGLKTTDDNCEKCQGSGQIRKIMGPVNISFACNDCRGSGKKSVGVCKECEGTGKTKKVEELEIEVPAGVRLFSHIKTKQDLIIQIKVKESGNIKLLDPNVGVVHSEVEINLETAILGGTTKIETLDGIKELKIKAGHQPTDTVAIEGGGIGGLNGLGSHLISTKIKNLPKNLTEEQQKLFKKFQESLGEENV